MISLDQPKNIENSEEISVKPLYPNLINNHPKQHQLGHHLGQQLDHGQGATPG